MGGYNLLVIRLIIIVRITVRREYFNILYLDDTFGVAYN